eukprot:403361493
MNSNNKTHKSGFSLSHSYFKIMISCLISTTLINARSSLPDNWWELSLAEPVPSSQEYFELIQGPYKDKFVFIDFYMDYCSWCYYILDDFNRLINDMNAWYGTDKVAFLKVDGVKIKKLSEMYKVPSYPHFVVVIPNTQGKTYTAFKYTPRNYDTLKKWMLEVMGDTKMISTPQKAYQAETASTPLNPGTAANTVNAQKLQQTGSVTQQQVEIPQVRSYAQQQQQQINTNNYDQGQQKQNYQNNELDQLKEQLNQILNSNADQINQQHEELHSQIKTITQLTQDQASKFEELYSVLKKEINEDENKIDKLQGMQLSPATYVLLGVVGGCISAVVLITYVSKSNQSQKKRKYRRGGPSSGSPLTGGLDEEKSA